ncbi:MAG: sulfurtransferase TusA family protein [Deltaproteobacteria bacterium]|nr:sulfurtransferase TusA family protein [Deltaproteobacteria bacterium]
MLWKTPTTLAEDLHKLKQQWEAVLAGRSPAAEFRAFRVPFGVYEQRQDGTYMLRVRVAAGLITAAQAKVVAAAARQFGSGRLHVTTRQDIQIHDVKIEQILPALSALFEGGLTTKGGGGNTVRNVTACDESGICAEELFDVAPYALALTEFLIAQPTSFKLPRKFKVAVSGCAEDCTHGAVNDVGLIAKRRGDTNGFAVYCGGGMGAKSRIADLLEEFVPGTEVHLTVAAIKNVFDVRGNRRNRRHARLRFLVEDLGLEAFRAAYRAELEALKREGVAPLSLPEPVAARALTAGATAKAPAEGAAKTEKRGKNGANEKVAGGAADLWRELNVAGQRQPGLFTVHVPLELGDLSAAALSGLAEVAAHHGDGLIRLMPTQNAALFSVPEAELGEVERGLAPHGLAKPTPASLRQMISCAGASTCRLGITLSRGLAKAIYDEVENSELDLKTARAATLCISGCPNACGGHPLAALGFMGAARRVQGQLIPHYVVQLSGRVGAAGVHIASGNLAIPARRVPAFVVELLTEFRASKSYPDFNAFLDAGGRKSAEAMLDDLHRPELALGPEATVDWGADKTFSLAERGPGECGAGVFDLIVMDLGTAAEALASGQLLKAVVHAARALLVTRGHDARAELEAVEIFAREFVDAGLVPERFRPLVDAAKHALKDKTAFAGSGAESAELVQTVKALYDGMDDSLQFHTEKRQDTAAAPSAEPAPSPAAAATTATVVIKVDREADLRGVLCPLNYVKTKMLLDRLKSGQVLSVLLSQEGANNVQESVTRDGHQILALGNEQNALRLTIRRA